MGRRQARVAALVQACQGFEQAPLIGQNLVVRGLSGFLAFPLNNHHIAHGLGFGRQGFDFVVLVVLSNIAPKINDFRIARSHLLGVGAQCALAGYFAQALGDGFIKGNRCVGHRCL